MLQREKEREMKREKERGGESREEKRKVNFACKSREREIENIHK